MNAGPRKLFASAVAKPAFIRQSQENTAAIINKSHQAQETDGLAYQNELDLSDL